MAANDSNDVNKELLRRREAIRQGGGPKAIKKQHAKGKLTARQRIDRLLDPGSFQEVDPYITHRHTAFGLDQKRFIQLDGNRLALSRPPILVEGTEQTGHLVWERVQAPGT